MKSSIEDLRGRGLAQNHDIDKFIELSYEELMDNINSQLPTERTSAIRILYNKFGCNDKKFIVTILDRLCIEKSLYTKLEICSVLEAGNISTAKEIIKYLGKIGNNQHKSLPDKISKKVSYPLPRDIIARSLGKMNKSILPVLIDVLDSKEKYKIYEVLDAIGFLVFYNKDLVDFILFEKILKTAKMYSDDDLMMWKGVICFSAFSIEESVAVLTDISRINPNKLIRDEASRSLKLIMK